MMISRRHPPLAAVFGTAVLIPGLTFAQAQPMANAPAAQFVATTVNLNPGGGQPLSIRILRWSTDEERDRIASLFTDKGEAELQVALAAAPTVGYVWTAEALGYALRYAYRMQMPDGGERIILATDRRLGSWTRGGWKPTGAERNYGFTVLELRLNRGRIGEGKMSLNANVVVEPQAKTLALENFGTAPVLLRDVKPEAARSATSDRQPASRKQ